MPRVYQHYKGGIYSVLGAAIHTETNERLVIYEDVRGTVFARPTSMFHSDVVVDGKAVSRFKFLGEFSRNESMKL